MVMHVMTLRAKINTVILANLVIGENVVPEFLQRDCTPQKLADALVPLLSDTPERQRQVAAFGRLDAIMGIGTATPSAKAAAIVLDVAQRGRRDRTVVAAAGDPN
jgi:lipid-A-disaccharide synthase